MKKIIISLIISSLAITGMAQLYSRKEIKIPDILGYFTLKCDLHIHTVFSDGHVWPTVRVDEAWMEGLDAIAISDHVEWRPYQKDIPIQFGRSYEIAKPRADMAGLILIRAAEITRDMPPGHFNCLFLEDIKELDKPDFWDAIKAADDQGAFIMWNHPGWRQENEIPIWYDDHTKLYEDGYMHGMEIVNVKSYYPLAQEWCFEKGITMLGNSDIHSPITFNYDLSNDDQRTMTLVFAEERTKEAIKDALFKGRTAVFAEGKLYGKEEFVQAIFYSSIEIVNKDVEVKPGEAAYLQVKNTSDIPFKLIAGDAIEEFSFPMEVTLYPERTVLVRTRCIEQAKPGVRTVKLPFFVDNLLVGSGNRMEAHLEFKANIVK